MSAISLPLFPPTPTASWWKWNFFLLLVNPLVFDGPHVTGIVQVFYFQSFPLTCLLWRTRLCPLLNIFLSRTCTLIDSAAVFAGKFFAFPFIPPPNPKPSPRKFLELGWGPFLFSVIRLSSPFGRAFSPYSYADAINYSPFRLELIPLFDFHRTLSWDCSVCLTHLLSPFVSY